MTRLFQTFVGNRDRKQDGAIGFLRKAPEGNGFGGQLEVFPSFVARTDMHGAGNREPNGSAPFLSPSRKTTGRNDKYRFKSQMQSPNYG